MHSKNPGHQMERLHYKRGNQNSSQTTASVLNHVSASSELAGTCRKTSARKTCQPSSLMEPAGTEAEGTTKDELAPDDRQGPPDGEQAMERRTEGGC